MRQPTGAATARATMCRPRPLRTDAFELVMPINILLADRLEPHCAQIAIPAKAAIAPGQGLVLIERMAEMYRISQMLSVVSSYRGRSIVLQRVVQETYVGFKSQP